MATKQISLSTESIPISKRTSAAALARRKAIADELLKQSMTPMGRGVIEGSIWFPTSGVQLGNSAKRGWRRSMLMKMRRIHKPC